MKYLCVSWKGGSYIQHIAIEGFATASGIQGGVVDAMVALLNLHGIDPCIKWVDDFIFFRSPNSCFLALSFSTCQQSLKLLSLWGYHGILF